MATLVAKQTALSWFVGRDAMKTALIDSFRRLTPRYQWRNPVMFVVYIGSILTTILWLQALAGKGEAPAGFILAVTLWLWVDAAVRELRRGDRRRPQQSAGRLAQERAQGHDREEAREAAARRAARRPRRRRTCARAISCSWNRAISSPATAK